MTKRNEDPDKGQVLIIQTASIGDVILATALIESIHQLHPAKEIDFLVRKGHESLFDGHPFLRSVLTWDKNRNKYRNLMNLAGKIRKTQYDHVINIQRFLSTGLLTVLSGAASTTGFSKNPLSVFFTNRVRHQVSPGMHETMRNQALLAPGMNYPTCRPKLYPTPADFNAVSSYEREPLYTISPASLWFTKQYPAEKWVELIARIPSHANICLLGAKSDDALCKSIIAQSGHGGLVNLAGKLTLLQSAALMKKSRMNFTNDSAPMHLASAMNASVTAVFCSTIPGFGFGPLSDNSVVAEIPGDLACRPCGLHGQRSCPQQHFKCAFEIQVESLLKNV